ncbi:MAG: prolipoprotein diacylglyceryl transferase [Actinomycetia bacterium]|nr:prolipoprotein diacylglyceryl transferase [Actinomycetes bacterium]MCH9737231.1 prolipoprotein diacylglyceryl transferase [Actinomycetes bacterium]MCH9831677.1 prolipoprotein diacylglyceryl transferase [Actinomycetes bacterium]MCH9841032.1 prolipoprotein diacylglyceryl transferase [Actinomycetes bacterium]
MPGSTPGFIPSPDTGVWNLGPVPIRAYAMFIVLGIIVAVVLGNKRYEARGGRPGVITDIAIWAVPFGIVGGRIYHVLSDWQIYFGAEGAGFVAALRIWDGGLGIWGAVALGAVGTWIGARRNGVALPPVADAIAPGLALAQAIGRWGNYFNQELFGSPTTLPWGLEISPENRPSGYGDFSTFHPTFLYESLWLVGVAVVVIWADRRFNLGHGRAFALYVVLYTAGRVWIEALRIDSANEILGLRLNIWTSIIVGLGALAYLVISARLKPGRELIVQEPEPNEPETVAKVE